MAVYGVSMAAIVLSQRRADLVTAWALVSGTGFAVVTTAPPCLVALYGSRTAGGSKKKSVVPCQGCIETHRGLEILIRLMLRLEPHSWSLSDPRHFFNLTQGEDTDLIREVKAKVMASARSKSLSTHEIQPKTRTTQILATTSHLTSTSEKC